MALKLRVDGVDAGYGAVRALSGVSIAVAAGETVALLGANGNGKSTLTKCIMGLVRPTKGTITLEIDGATHDLTRLPAEAIVELGVALVPEGRRLFPKLTVEENLLLGAFRPQARKDLQKNLAFAVEVFPILHERRRQLAGSLSGGQQQMLAIGRALMSKPSLLMLDEPSLGLAPVIVERIGEVLAEIQATENLAVLLAEQNATWALSLARRGVILDLGRIRMAGEAAALLDDPDVRKAYLGV